MKTRIRKTAFIALAVAVAVSMFLLVRPADTSGILFRVVRTSPEDGVISAHEPVILKAEFTNNSSEPYNLYYSYDMSARLEILDKDGVLVGESPIYPYGEIMSTMHILQPNESSTSYFIPSAVYTFKDPGKYNIKIKIYGEPIGSAETPEDLGTPVAETSVSIRVLPFDEARLSARCDELLYPKKKDLGYLPDCPRAENMKALFSVRHNAALPALKFAAENWGESSYGWPTAVAIKRIGTKESASLLKELKPRKDRIGKCALGADEEYPKIHMEDYFTGWKTPDE